MSDSNNIKPDSKSGASASSSSSSRLASRFGFVNKTALVTGSTAGIGKAIAEGLIAGGCKVLINGRKQATVDQAVTDLNQQAEESGSGGLAVAAVGDVGTAEGCEALCKLVDNLGDIDILVNNVGIFEVKDFFEIKDEDWTKYFEINIMSTVRMTRHFLQRMLDRNLGKIVTISSEAGIRGFSAMPHYAMTKTAQISIMRSLAGLTRGTNVRINTVLPGPTWTEGVAEYMKGVAAADNCSVDQAVSDYFKKNEPTSLLGRFLTPEEVANTAIYLASDMCTGTNGASYRVEGGIVEYL